MANDHHYQNLLNLCVNELESCVNYVHRHSDSKDENFEAIKDVAREYCEIDISYKKAKVAQQATDNYFDNEENDCTEDVQQIYNKFLEEQTDNNSYENHSIWHTIYGAISGDTQLDSEKQSDEVDNQSIYEGITLSHFNPPIDPITKKMITTPCKNRVCEHVYEYSSIMDFVKGFKERKSKPLCPHIGCSNKQMRKSDIVKDNAMKKLIQEYLEENKQGKRNSLSLMECTNDSE